MAAVNQARRKHATVEHSKDSERQRFPPKRDYSSLSIKDLLDARDAYHLHLSHLTNVVATAIGRYRIRETDWYVDHPLDSTPPSNKEKYRPTYARTLYNSLVRKWSWPCVLVFVSEWVPRGSFGTDPHEIEPDQIVPDALYLPDGRIVPTCVIRVEEGKVDDSAHKWSFPRKILGGGYLLQSDEQRRLRVGSVGCLVTDGDSVYALTNRHVTGPEGRPIHALIQGQPMRVGESSKRQLSKKDFSDVYKGWSGTNVLANLDAGLVKLDDVRRWTTQVFGIGQLHQPVDLTTDSISLDLIGYNVRAFGGASGLLLGEIAGLFYRYKSMGGTDYVTDFLIGPRTGPDGKPSRSARARRSRSRAHAAKKSAISSMKTLPGDSGTLWCWEDTNHDPKSGSSSQPKPKPQSGSKARAKDTDPKSDVKFKPIALQWGGHVFSDGGQRKSNGYALATCLSTILRELDLDVMLDWNTGLPEYWGDMGHYTIAYFACRNVQERQLKVLMNNNVDRISFEEDQLRPKSFKGLSTAEFVPLADVPDKVWKMFGKGRRGQPEHPNHFADMDKKGSDKRSLLDICSRNGSIRPEAIDVKVWQDYYDDVGDKSRGCLPFRVWQIYDFMVASAKRRKITEFVCAAGVLAHYVGDACQPLHISAMFDGDPDDPSPDGDRPRARGVHSAYETSMLNKNFDALLSSINEATKQKSKRPARVSGGHGAAVAVVDLMRETFETLSPAKIIEAYVDDKDLWEEFQKQTVRLIVRGALTLAVLWESAWKEGLQGREVEDGALEAVSMEDLTDLYQDPDFLPSMTLDELAKVLPSPSA